MGLFAILTGLGLFVCGALAGIKIAVAPSQDQMNSTQVRAYHALPRRRGLRFAVTASAGAVAGRGEGSRWQRLALPRVWERSVPSSGP